MTDRIRYESKKAFAEAAGGGNSLAPGLKAFAEAAGGGNSLAPGLKAFAAAMARWTAQREIAKLVAKRKNAREDTGQPEDFEP